MSLDKIRARAKQRRQGQYLGRVVSHGCFGELSPLSGGGISSSGLISGNVITQTPTLESSTTNLLLQSAAFDNASWVKTNAVIVADSTIAPNGVVEADTLNDNSAAAMGEVRQNVAIANDGLTRVFSVYLTGGTSTQTRVRLLLSGGVTVDQSVDLNPTSGTIITQTGSPSVQTISIAGVNWFRVSIPATNNNSGNVTAQCIINPASASVGAQATVIAWGAQLEQLTATQVLAGSAPTSQIPTGAAQVTRTAGKIPNWAVEGTMPQGVSINSAGAATGFKQPTITSITSGSGTYNAPAGCTRIEVEVWGGGGGGGASGPVNGTAGNNSTFSTLTANGGARGDGGASGANAAGGGATGGDLNFTGGFGGASQNFSTGGPQGGGSGGGVFKYPSGNAVTGSNQPGGNGQQPGGGAAGGGAIAAGTSSGGGGGGGGYCFKVFTAPFAGISYAVGGTANGGSGSGQNGGTGAAGMIIIREYYQ